MERDTSATSDLHLVRKDHTQLDATSPCESSRPTSVNKNEDRTTKRLTCGQSDIQANIQPETQREKPLD